MGELYFLDRGGRTHRFDVGNQSVVTLGRGDENDIVLADPIISATHAQIWYSRTDATYYFRDLGSSNGSWVDGELAREVALNESAIVYLGDLLAVFVAASVFDGIGPSKDDFSITDSQRLDGNPISSVHCPTSWDGSPPNLLLMYQPAFERYTLFPTRSALVKIGRNEANDVVISSSAINEFHAELSCRENTGAWKVIEKDGHVDKLTGGKMVCQEARNVIEIDGVHCWLEPPCSSGRAANGEQQSGKLNGERSRHKNREIGRDHRKITGSKRKYSLNKGDESTEQQANLDLPAPQSVQVMPKNGTSIHAPSHSDESPKNLTEISHSDSQKSKLLKTTAAEIDAIKRELNQVTDDLWKLRDKDPDSIQAIARRLMQSENALIERLGRARKALSDLLE